MRDEGIDLRTLSGETQSDTICHTIAQVLSFRTTFLRVGRTTLGLGDSGSEIFQES